jgi:hypothetical protein
VHVWEKAHGSNQTDFPNLRIWQQLDSFKNQTSLKKLDLTWVVPQDWGT